MGSYVSKFTRINRVSHPAKLFNDCTGIVDVKVKDEVLSVVVGRYPVGLHLKTRFPDKIEYFLHLLNFPAPWMTIRVPFWPIPRRGLRIL